MKTEGLLDTVALFPVLDKKLIQLLRSLSPDDWQKPTLAGNWTVKDIAGHLLDGNIRTLSMLRDGYFGAPAPGISSYQDLVGYLNDLNAEWVAAMRRVSPAVLIDLLESTGREYSDYLATLDLHAKAAFSVAWAGEQESQNWFHIARDYTEKWHHQQQIRVAVGEEQELFTKAIFRPYLETSLRALPYHYRTLWQPVGTTLKFLIRGEIDYIVFLSKEEDSWQLLNNYEGMPDSTVEVGQEIIWRIFSKGISPAEAQKYIRITGQTEAGAMLLNMLAVMA
jgi:uncharacterized protein (TIGR03083 family)